MEVNNHSPENEVCSQVGRALRLTFILVLDGHLIITLQLPPEDTLHHQHQLIVGDVLIVDGDTSNIVTQLGFDDQLSTQVQLAVHGAV